MLQRQLTYNSKPEDYVILFQGDQTSFKNSTEGKRGKVGQKFCVCAIFSENIPII